ncbi:hypothetical protein QVD17_17392 [Tagetes erecta]|uniref:Uncharacterized protein n=1 Tax=Tagetes erecta TaxID=13708 RepID=A0AAD8KWR4_TARER|nr:hypothetical protein QVD17_17392 [Tagetes erecta]
MVDVDTKRALLGDENYYYDMSYLFEQRYLHTENEADGNESDSTVSSESDSNAVVTKKWAVDLNKYACESLKLNHPETEAMSVEKDEAEIAEDDEEDDDDAGLDEEIFEVEKHNLKPPPPLIVDGHLPNRKPFLQPATQIEALDLLLRSKGVAEREGMMVFEEGQMEREVTVGGGGGGGGWEITKMEDWVVGVWV